MNSAGVGDPRTVLVVKLSAIGDVIQTLPMVEALKRRYPRVRIDWLVEEEASDLLFGHPAIHRVIVSRRKTWLRQLLRKGEFWGAMQEIGRFLRELRSQPYDWVIDNHGILKSGLLVMLSRGKRKIGYKALKGISEEGSYLFTNERYQSLSIERHALERYLDLASQMGVPVEEATLEYPLSRDLLLNAESLLRQEGFFSRPLVVIHPMAKWETKQWPPENFSRLISALAKGKSSVVVTGGPQDVEPVKEILSRVEEPAAVLNLAGKTGLKELAGIFALADLVITPDTGPMHIAAAVKAPLIALFGPTAPWRTGPYGDHNLVIRRDLPCSPCFKKKCSTLECMNSITVEEVLIAAFERLRGGS
jgi:lipopolysaccharide heptosyltransferase I